MSHYNCPECSGYPSTCTCTKKETKKVLGVLKIYNAASEAVNEVKRATEVLQFPKFNSAHEGFAILLEEVEELKAHVWMNQSKRDIEAMRKEAVQVAAMALRFIVDVCDEQTGRK